jgi:hypothetical protein
MKIPFLSKFWGAQHENEIKNRELALVSNLLLVGEEGCFRNSVQETKEKAPHLFHVSSLLCPGCIQQHIENFLTKEPIP